MLTYVLLVFGVTIMHELILYILKIGLAEEVSKPLAAITVVFIVFVVTFVNYKNMIVNYSFRLDYMVGFLFLVMYISLNLIYDNTLGLIKFPNGPIEISNQKLLNTDIFTGLRICIISPLLEEYFFRVRLLSYLRGKYSNQKALIISALIFALMHVNYGQSLNAFFVGVFLAIVFIETESFFIVSILHIVNNSVVYLSFKMLPKSMIENYFSFNIYILVIGIIIFLLSGFLLWKKGKIITLFKDNVVTNEV